MPTRRPHAEKWACALVLAAFRHVDGEVTTTAEPDNLTYAGSDPVTCLAPAYVQHSYVVTCQEGKLVRHGAVCTAHCRTGYTPDHATLDCVNGILVPEIFACIGDGCAAPTGIDNALDHSCLEGQDLPNLGFCTARCQSGYAPFPAVLNCTLGRLYPEVFSCRTPYFEDVGARQVVRSAVASSQGQAKRLVEMNLTTNVRSATGASALHFAAISGQKSLAQEVLDGGADVNAADRGGWSPLHLAVSSGHLAVTDLLLAHGANATARTNEGQTPGDMAIAISRSVPPREGDSTSHYLAVYVSVVQAARKQLDITCSVTGSCMMDRHENATADEVTDENATADEATDTNDTS